MLAMHNPGAAEPFAIYWCLWRHLNIDGICMCAQTVKHRWLDESAPMKLSPLREALEAGKTLLGDKLPPLDLEAAQVPNLPKIIPLPPDAAEAAALDDAAQLAAGPAPDQDTPMRDAQPDQAAGASETVPSPDQNAGQVQAAQPDEEMGLSQEAPSLEHVQLLAEDQLETPELAPGPSSTKSSGRGRGRGRGRGGRGRSSSRGRGRGRKRKVNSTPKGVSIAISHLHDSLFSLTMTFCERHIQLGETMCSVLCTGRDRAGCRA